MSTASGTPSKKIGWYRSMIDKLDHQNRLNEVERKKDEDGQRKTSKRSKRKDKPATETP
jgi:hypothetical protein